MYAPGYLIKRLAGLQAIVMRRRMASDKRPDEAGMWQMVEAETMTLVDNIV
jgi:hypothetical protein